MHIGRSPYIQPQQASSGSEDLSSYNPQPTLYWYPLQTPDIYSYVILSRQELVKRQTIMEMLWNLKPRFYTVKSRGYANKQGPLHIQC